ncbi:MAG TPA: hypothetical protein VK678_14530 [Bradyrhizobium sp.]|nr:hypothetical protein [Bradyrhizobium sp.]
MARARFEKIDEIQNDTIKLMPEREKDETSRIPGNRKRQPTERRPDQSAPGIGAICIVRSIEGWHTHMWHSDVEERSWTG